jgi:hypothetical protein
MPDPRTDNCGKCKKHHPLSAHDVPSLKCAWKLYYDEWGGRKLCDNSRKIFPEIFSRQYPLFFMNVHAPMYGVTKVIFKSDPNGPSEFNPARLSDNSRLPEAHPVESG